MKKRTLLLAASSFILTACTYTPVPLGQTEKLYDFDHKVHYKQTKLKEDHFILSVRADSYKHFATQSIFLLRYSKRLCQGKTPQLKLLAGVQGFDRLPTHPRPYQPDLKAEVQCVKIKK